MKKMIIDVNKLALKQRHFTTSELNRGTGVHKPKKGKGSYKRNNKYKKNYKGD